ncbi:MAG: family 43 glycosylhydrolase [Tannerella sp.]|jgi:hypothetical protein|nr:family 43 glycosylhydrolase [Tannerella sp.]
MFKLKILLCILLTGNMVFSQNPVSPPGVYIADPTARVDANGKIYIYGSLDMVAGEYCSTRHHVLSSGDLLNWTLHPNSFASAGEGDAVPYSDRMLYAPDMMYHNGMYYLYYCMSDGSEGVATAGQPEGRFVNGQKIEGVHGIDPTVFVDDDGQAYYYWGQFSAKGARLNPDMKTVDSATVIDDLVTEQTHFFHEGGFVFKRAGVYYFVYTHIGRQDRATCIGYSTATHPLGPFKYGGVIIDNAGCDPESWNNHGSVAEFRNRWYVFYHRSTHGSQSMRKACVEPIEFLPDGSIPEVPMTSQGAGNPFDARKQIDAARACLLWGNVRIVRDEKHPDNEILSAIRHNDRAAWKYLDYGNGLQGFKVRVRSKSGGKIVLAGDKPWTSTFGSITVPENCDWTELSCEIKPKSGVETLWIRFEGNKEKDLFEIDSFVFF